MTGTRNRRKPAEVLFLCTAFHFLLFFAGSVDYYSTILPREITRLTGTDAYSAPAAWGILAGYCVLFLLMIRIMLRLIRSVPLSAGLRERIRTGGDSRNILLLLAVTAVPRIVWLLAGSPRLESDYALYVAMGMEYAGTGTLTISDYVLKIASNVPLYTVLLGNMMRLFGSCAATAQWFCLLLYTGSVLLLYGIGRNMTTRSRALLAALLFSLLPENIFYAALPGIEAPSMFTMLAGLLLITGIGRQKTAGRIVMCIAGGALIAFSACFRPNAWAAAGVAVIWLVCRFRFAIPLRRILAWIAAIAAGAAAVMIWHHAFQNRVYTGEKPAGMAIGWPLYEGLDMEGAGQWTQEKSDHCRDVIQENSAKDADRIFMTEAWERFRGYSFFEKIRMFLRKGGSIWMDSSYAVSGKIDEGIRYALPAGASYVAWMIFISLWLACLVFRGLHPLAAGNARTGCVFCLAVVLLTALWHEFGTSISRYHYMVIPFMTLMTAMMIPGKMENEPPDDDAGSGKVKAA